MTTKRVKKKIFHNILIYIIIIGLIFFFGYVFGGLKGQKELQSQCFTNLQPSEYFTENLIEVKKIGGILVRPKGAYDVVITTPTGSMRPAISDNSKMIIVNPNTTKIRVGDIILLKTDRTVQIEFAGQLLWIPKGEEFIHRVIKIENEFSGNPIYITKGDNSPFIDPFRTNYSMIQAKVVGILY